MRDVDEKYSTENFLGLNTYAGDLAALISSIEKVIDSEQDKKWLACINPHSYVQFKKMKVSWQKLCSASWIIPDGVGIIVASALLRKNIKYRVTGSDVFYALNKSRENRGVKTRVFFLGSSEETLSAISRKISCDYENIIIAGFYSPPFKDSFSLEENNKIISMINGSKSDILWVGMTAPKQETWIADHIDKIDIKFAGAIGAVFDFYVGNVRRPNAFVQKYYLEWLVRLCREPLRLWRRTFVSLPIFFYFVVRHMLV